MCGFVGLVDYKQNLSTSKNILQRMNNTLYKRGPDEEGLYINNHVALSHKRLVVIDKHGGKQPMIEKFSFGEYVIVYNGQIYNTKDLYKTLKENGFTLKGYSDTELLLKSFMFFGYDVVNHLNGIFSFAIWNSNTEELFLARDHFGVKPLFYTIQNNTLLFASEIKALFEHPKVEKIVDKIGLSELFGLGPAHTPGNTIYKNIYEIKPAHFAIYNKLGFKTKKYWELNSKTHTDNFKTTCEKIKFLLNDSIEKQLVSDVPLGIMLSGGLDSSIIVAYANKYLQKRNLLPINTFSVDYIDNDKHFVKNDFQPNSDNYYINIMKNKFNTNHNTITIDTPELADALENSMISRDAPGMADVDSSFLLFCKHIKKHATVCLSGECSDEIFAGYPWFFREDALNSNTFPWSIALTERTNLLHPYIQEKIDIKQYINYRYSQSLKEVKILDTDSKETAQKRKISYLTITWFMQTLLERSDRSSMYNGLELRVPFCDYRLVEYLWNIPWEIKSLHNREKGLLRYVVKDLLPTEIIERKKSPYPKTHNPNYLEKVKNILQNIVQNPNSPINNLLNKNVILEILKTNGSSFSRPWFGQLMTGPQLIAYLCQVNMWLEKYNPKIEI